MSLIPQPRYDGLRTFADLIIDAVFGQPLRHFQEFFRNRHARRQLRRIRSVYRTGCVKRRRILEAAFPTVFLDADAQRDADARRHQQDWGHSLNWYETGGINFHHRDADTRHHQGLLSLPFR